MKEVASVDNPILVRAEHIGVKKGNATILNDISFILHKGDHLAITGPSGSGKTTLALALSNKIFYSGTISYTLEGNLVWVEQQHHFKNLSNTSDFYYQQRFNSFDAGDAHTVAEYLSDIPEKMEAVIADMKIGYLLSKPLIQLSNGENKKVQIAKALLSDPGILVLDQPFVGLDADTRAYLHTLINRLAETILIIVVTGTGEIPGCINRVILLEKEGRHQFLDRKEFEKNKKENQTGRENQFVHTSFPVSQDEYEFDTVLRMDHVNVQYGDKKILQDINWEVKKGEKWLLSGANGAGKSTLLSLVTADNPQAYANEIYLFDRRRGSGESIWDIKKKTGFLSPELHLYFDYSCTCFEVVASGLFDTIGLFRQLSEEQVQLVYQWMEALDICSFARKRLQELSAGQQRVVLLGRALIKNPPLLVLDEPCQGLDEETEDSLIRLIDAVCALPGKTLIYVTHYAAKRPFCIKHFLQLENGRVK